jgi:flavin reductase (DIM6/NTAB) family NADH-FMN oxidoreductase RutF/rubredoxin
MNLNTFRQICYGVYIISSRKGDRINGQIANTVFQITSEPPTVAVSINKKNLTHEYVQDSKVFSISILSKEATMPFIGTFGFKSGRDIDKFVETKYKKGVTGAPVILEYTVGYLECEVLSATDAGTHTVFIGKVVECDTLSDSEPMTYAFYHEVRGGKSPKSAPTFIPEEKKPTPPTAAPGKYRCKICGWVYDPELGDPDNGVATGTPFEALPDAWVCPICGAPKSEFEKID